MTGVKYGFQTLQYARPQLPSAAKWTAFDTGRRAFRLLALSEIDSGQVGIRMEDAAWLGKDELAPSIAAMVGKEMRMFDDLGFGLASAAETRETLDLRR